MAKCIMVNLWLMLCIAAVSSSNVLLTPNNPKYIKTLDKYAKTCAPTIKCNAMAKYRTIDGSCNNLRIPWLGAVKTPHLRLLDPEYADGKYKFRRQSNGRPLPNARQINVKVLLGRSSWISWRTEDKNVLFMEWGQFIAHDITLLPPDTSVGADCCALQKQNPVPAQCRAVIKVPKNDPVYPKYGQRCINFNRAVTSAADGCQLKPTTFMVGTTHYMDGSQIYGTDEKTAASLRSFQDGRLKSEKNFHNMEFCPQMKRKSTVCDSSKNSNVCYVAGDPRVNQNMAIALFQNTFLRFHNVVAAHLTYLNPHWSDEILYQESRRFVVAVIQHITYTKYLPILLGTEIDFLNEKQTIYDEKINPSTSQEFTSGAFRILHSQIPSELDLYQNSQFYHVPITDWMDRPDLLPISNNFDGFFYGLLNQHFRSDKTSYNPYISSFLFPQTTEGFKGQDLMAADIQRGRDTGVPPYNKMRSFCGISEAETFDDLLDLIDKEDVNKLKEVYSSVDDIDFVVGALLERHEPGVRVGPTAKCIISDSFYRYKSGDRFFYDVVGQPGSFTPDQLKTIKNISFNNVLCATTGLQVMPTEIFSPMNGVTEKYGCMHFPINLEAWKENTELPRTPTQKLKNRNKPQKKVSKK